jgi:integrase
VGKLTVKIVENLTAPGTYEDGSGLRLVVKASGRKSWVWRYQIEGKRRELGLGGFPTVGLKDARIAAAEMRAKIHAGKDPLVEREIQREESKATHNREVAKKIVFSTVADDYISAHRAGWKNAKHAQQWRNTISTHAFAVIGHLAPAEIETSHILQVLQPIWNSKPETATRLRSRLELILDSAKARGLRGGENPSRWRGHLDKLLPKRSKIAAVKHYAALPWLELPAFMSDISIRAGLAFRAMQLTILTATRTSEVLNASWDEFDLKTGTWAIPGERMKTGKPHRIPLAPQVVDLLKSLPRIDGSPFLFPGEREGRPLSSMSMLMGLRRMNRGDLTMHGFRSCFRDWAAEATTHPREVAEHALAHTVSNKSEAAYFRSDLFEKRRALMADWAAFATQQTAMALQQRGGAE